MLTPSASAIRRSEAMLALGATSLDLAQEALAETGALGDVAQRASARNADRPETLADIDFTRNLTHARRQRAPSEPSKKNEVTLRTR